MSTLFIDQSVWVVQVVLNKKDGSGTTTYNLGLDYWDTGKLYTASPKVYPILSNAPFSQRSMGQVMPVRENISISLYGKAYLDEYGKTFFDLLDLHEVRGSTLTLFYYPKPTDAITTHSASVNTMQVLDIETVNHQPETGVMVIQCREKLFRNKNIAKKLTTAVFPDLDERWDGEYGQIVIGQATDTATGILIDAPIVRNEINSTTPEADIFINWEDPYHATDSFQGLYVKNPRKDYDKRDWLLVDLPANPQAEVYGNNSAGTTAVSLRTYDVAFVFSPATNAHIISLMKCEMLKVGTPTATIGTITCSLYHAQYLPDADTFAPIGSVLSQASKDPQDAVFGVGTDEISFQFPNNVVCSAEVNYMCVLSWSNYDDAANYFNAYDVASGSDNYYRKDKSQRDKGWEKVSGRLIGMALYAVGTGGGLLWGQGTAPYKHAVYGLEAAQALLATGDTRLEIDSSLQFKVGMTGLEDDTSGTYTGTASAIMKNPADVVRWLLQNDTFGGSVSLSRINTSTFTATRANLLNFAHYLQIVVREDMDIITLISKICRQARIQLYLTKDGLFSVRYPSSISSYTATLSELFTRDDMIIIEDQENDPSDVVNKFLNQYAIDITNQSNDLAQVRRANDPKFTGSIELDGTTSTSGDTARQTACATSQTLFGIRQNSENFDYIDNETIAMRTQNYLADRNVKLQGRVTVRLPLKKWYNTLELFSTLYLEHTALESASGTSDSVKVFDDGTPIPSYDEGLPVVVGALGVHAGEVVGIRAQGSFIYITTETVPSF